MRFETGHPAPTRMPARPEQAKSTYTLLGPERTQRSARGVPASTSGRSVAPKPVGMPADRDATPRARRLSCAAPRDDRRARPRERRATKRRRQGGGLATGGRTTFDGPRRSARPARAVRLAPGASRSSPLPSLAASRRRPEPRDADRSRGAAPEPSSHRGSYQRPPRAPVPHPRRGLVANGRGVDAADASKEKNGACRRLASGVPAGAARFHR